MKSSGGVIIRSGHCIEGLVDFASCTGFELMRSGDYHRLLDESFQDGQFCQPSMTLPTILKSNLYCCCWSQSSGYPCSDLSLFGP